jgi:hypothetical protein
MAETMHPQTRDSLQPEEWLINHEVMIRQSVCPKRSSERHTIMTTTLAQLAPFGHWSPKDVRNYWAQHMRALKNVFRLDVIRRHHGCAFDGLGNMIVNRFDQLETLIERCPRLCQGTMLKSLVEYFVHGNLPISQVDAPFFRTFVSCLNPGIANNLPNSHELRSTVIERAVALRNSIGVATSGSRFVSLMVDGMRKAGRAWLGICLDTASQMRFGRLVHDVDQNASTIANTVLDVRMPGLIVRSIVTDNA